MPLFSNISGVNIHGGNFYDVSGDMNVQNNQQFAIEENHEQLHTAVGGSQSARKGSSMSRQALVLSTADDGRSDSLSGIIPTTRLVGTGRPVSYDIVTQPQAHFQFEYPASANRSRNVHPDNWLLLSDITTFNARNGPHADPAFENGGAKEPTITFHGGTFIGGNVNNVLQSRETGLHILHRSISLDATHDSADSYPQPKCHPKTRSAMLENLYTWCITSKLRAVLWLYGPAGAGKSAIMRTLAERLADSGQLGGSFFFKRDHPTRGNAQKLFATLAYQLAFNIPQLKARISEIMEYTPHVVSKPMNVQLQKLVVEPCRQLGISQRITIIIDGLDECKEPGVQQEVLRCIGNSAGHEQDSPPLQFLIASRPEPHIREIFHGSFFHGFHHSFNVNKSLEDVEKYLTDEFARIHREHHHTMVGISDPWPQPAIIRCLAEKSSGYFIHAATVIKFVDDKNFRPIDRLKTILLDASDIESPFSALDQLYAQIL
ncbi:hypothetical protein C8J57DRAFT_1678964, partial [Mycena rebaudengoi]